VHRLAPSPASTRRTVSRCTCNCRAMVPTRHFSTACRRRICATRSGAMVMAPPWTHRARAMAQEALAHQAGLRPGTAPASPGRDGGERGGGGRQGHRGGGRHVSAQARAPRWCGVSMRPVEPQPPRAGNPGASRSAAGRRRRHRHHHRAHGTVGASAATARRGQSGRAEIVGIDVRSRAGPRRAPGAGTAGRSSGCHGRSGCTAQPARGNARTGTGALEHPCPPRSTTEAAVLDGRVPAVPH
jgi:hypothetical protein